MEHTFKNGDIVRAKRAYWKRLLHLPILRSEIMTVLDVHEMQYRGETATSIGVSVRNLDGEEFHFSQQHLEKI